MAGCLNPWTALFAKCPCCAPSLPGQAVCRLQWPAARTALQERWHCPEPAPTQEQWGRRCCNSARTAGLEQGVNRWFICTQDPCGTWERRTSCYSVCTGCRRLATEIPASSFLPALVRTLGCSSGPCTKSEHRVGSSLLLLSSLTHSSCVCSPLTQAFQMRKTLENMERPSTVFENEGGEHWKWREKQQETTVSRIPH